MKQIYRQAGLHILGCCTFLALPMLFSPTPAKSFSFYTSAFGQRELLSYALLIVYFYLNYFLIIPRLYFTKRFWAFGAVTLACFLLVVWLPGLFIHPFDMRDGGMQRGDGFHEQMDSLGNDHGLHSNDQARFDTTGHGDNAFPGNDRVREQGPDHGPRNNRAQFDTAAHTANDGPRGNNGPREHGADHASRNNGLHEHNNDYGLHNNNDPRDHGPNFGPPHGDRRRFDFPLFGEISHTIFLFLVVLFFCLMIKVTNQWKQTEKQRLYAELSNLKAQINPHFLFNALNSIYSLSLEKSDLAPNAIIRLSGMMRYVIYEAGKEWVPLESEITYVQDYIALQKTRFGHSVDLTFTVTGNTLGKFIAPLVLIPFVENAFKHGVNPEEDSIIKIEITIDLEQVQLKVYNHKVHVLRYDANGVGIGLDNTRKRLDIIYPGQHKLTIQETPADYTVHLILSRL